MLQHVDQIQTTSLSFHHFHSSFCFLHRFLLESVSSETAFLEDYVLGMGDTLEMSCDLEDPTKPVVWFKDGAGLVPSNRTRLGQRMLRIINVSYEDSGVYSCRLAHSNTLLSNYTIKVTGESDVLFLTNMEGGEGAAGNSNFRMCGSIKSG